MRVLKIIQANLEIFNADQTINLTEIEAIKKIASMTIAGNKIQKSEFDIRQTHTAICNLFSLGFRDTAVELAIKIIPEAELSHQFKIAQDLCDKLITNFYQIGNIESADFYKNLYDKFTKVLSYEHESMILYGKAIYNYKQLLPIETTELFQLLNSIKQKLPVDTLWYHYYYYQCKSLTSKDKDLENIYIEAISYFENLYFKHTSFVVYFTDLLIGYYKENNDLEKAEILAQKRNEVDIIGS